MPQIQYFKRKEKNILQKKTQSKMAGTSPNT